MLTTVTESASRLAPSHFVVIAACAETKSGRNVFGDRIRRAGTSGGRILNGRKSQIIYRNTARWKSTLVQQALVKVQFFFWT